MLNYSDASINIVYEYDKYNRNDTTDDTSDDTIDREEKTFKLNLTGNQINILKQDPLSPEISKALNSNSEDLKRVYLKGGEGIMMEIDLFDDGTGNDILGEIKKGISDIAKEEIFAIETGDHFSNGHPEFG